MQATARRRCLEAERERDIAIDEAAGAYLELNRLRTEVETLRQEKEAWEAGRDAWSQRHEQILWHVSAMAESLWSACQQPDMSVETARLLALESFAQLVPKDDAQVYEEMHDLYATIAHMEGQQTKMSDKLRDLKRMNEERVETIRCWEETEGHSATSKDEEDTKGGCLSTEECGLAVVYPLPDKISTNTTSSTTDSSDAPAIELLQAQLGMYINYTKRHRLREQAASTLETRIDH